MKKAAFFDIDGTICEEITMHIPESTRVAIRSLRENGVYTFINSDAVNATPIINTTAIRRFTLPVNTSGFTAFLRL